MEFNSRLLLLTQALFMSSLVLRQADAQAGPWGMPRLLPMERDGVVWELNIEAGSSIEMDESMTPPVYLAKLNFAGEGTPFVGLFSTGVSVMLGADVRQNSEIDPDDPEAWYLVITQMLDYESDHVQFNFAVGIDEGTTTFTHTTAIFVQNIDDNAPTIFPATCRVPEGEEGPTECVYLVTDVDGWMSIGAMTIEILGTDNDRETFDFELERDEDINAFEMTIRLKTLKKLDFIEMALHSFPIRARDTMQYSAQVVIMVEVENVESRPPRWVQIFAVEQFDEKTYQEFPVRAIDGDTGINAEIFYELAGVEEMPFFSIDRNTGVFAVKPIDRDELQIEIFQFQIIAYKIGTRQVWYTPFDVVIIVRDVNDNAPEPLHTQYSIEILEETFMAVNFGDFGFHDIDLGVNAQYDVELVSVSPEGAAEAFTVVPNHGYQLQTFFITINDAPRLDFENITYQEITMRFRATERVDPDHIREAEVTIHLMNWNDEEPIFEEDSYTATFRENVGAGYSVITVKANDRDIDDRIVYNLLGNANNLFNIDQDTGEITVSEDDAFNYQRQNQIVIQITATDTLGADRHHTVTTQLTIELEDVNNTPPDIRMPRQTPRVKENEEDGEITDEVTGSDVDTSAIIVFEIDWMTTFATKQGRETSTEHYHNCVAVRTVYPDPSDTGNARASIYVTGDPIIDFEEFDSLFIRLRVIDTMTEYFESYQESTLTITIIDRNDNKPEFLVEPAELELVVREVSNQGVIIGSVQANDIDGPMYNQVGYTIEPRAGTPEDLVRIDNLTGQITVYTHQAIDADEPRYNLYYTITADDKCKQTEDMCGTDPPLETIGELTIQIIDTNNREPELSVFEDVISIYENATTGDYITTILASDRDRDEPHHTIHFSINFGEHPNLRNFFAVDENTGVVYVNYESDIVLDRDGGPDTHTIFLSLVDNINQDGDRNMNRVGTDVRVILLDVNDNAPVLPSPETISWEISENMQANQEIPGYVYAPDADEPGTDNSRVGYSMTLEIYNRVNIIIPDPLISIDTRLLPEYSPFKTGHLVTEQALKGFWGTYRVHIKAFDHGTPQLYDEETYDLTIVPFNFHNPVFTFPTDEFIIRVNRDHAMVTGNLLQLNDESLELISATDEDGLLAGTVDFTIGGNDAAIELFIITELPELPNMARMTIPAGLSELDNSYQFTLTATDRGDIPGPRSTTITVTVLFIATTGIPVFEDNQQTITFPEGEAGLSYSKALRSAEDPRNINCDGDDCIPIYHFIVGGTTAHMFNLDSTTNTLTVNEELDHDAVSQHTILVAAHLINSRPETPNTQSTLEVTIDVLESNPMPRFERSNYTAGVSVGDLIGRQLMRVHATHSLNEEILYAIDVDSMVVNPTLNAVQNSAFDLIATTGVLNLNFSVQASMTGMFEFDVTATDEQGAVARSEVRIFLVTELNRISFSFLNTLSEVDMETTFIADVFTNAFNMVCNVDSVTQGADAHGVAQYHITELRAHFVQDDIVVPATEIEMRRSDAALLRFLQETLSARNLNLADLFTSGITGQISDFDEVLRITLIILSVVLAVLCVLLLVGYCYKTRSLMRRLDSLSTTKFGSNESGLNRIGVVVPGTNKHAIQGSNPVWNEKINAPNFDNISEASGDSDLIGIEDNPHFKTDFFPPKGETLASISKRNSDNQNWNPNEFQYPEAPPSSSNTKVNPLFEKY